MSVFFCSLVYIHRQDIICQDMLLFLFLEHIVRGNQYLNIFILYFSIYLNLCFKLYTHNVLTFKTFII